MLRFGHAVALISASVALFTVLLLSAVLYSYFSVEFRSEIEARNQLVAQSMEGQIASELSLPVEVLTLLADRLSITDPVIYSEALLDRRIENHSFFEAVLLLNRDGETVALGTLPHLALYKEELRSTSMVFQPFFVEAVGQDSQYWSRVISSPITGEPSITLSMDTGNGVIVGYINLNWLEEIALGLEESGKLDIRLIDSNGVLLRDPDQERVKQRINVANVPIIANALVGYEDTAQFDYFGQSMLGSTVSIPSTQWVLVVSQSYEKAIEPLNNLLKISVLMALFSVSVGIFLALVLSRKGTHSIVRLSEDVRRIASGDYLFKPAAGGYTETRELSVDVQNLATSIASRETALKQAEDELLRINEELEERVEARTTELLESQAALRQSEELLVSLEASPIAVGITRNDNGKIIFANTRSSEMFGYSSEQILQIGIDDGWCRAGERTRLQKVFKNKGKIESEEVCFITANGEELWGLLTLSSVEMDGQECSLYWVYDITRLKKIEKALIVARAEAETATQAKSEFLANMSHEIRTPINAVIGLNHLMEFTTLDQRQQDYLTKIHNASAHLLSVINDILDFSKLDGGQMVMESLPFRIDEVLEKACDIVRLQAENKGIDVLVVHDWDMPVDVMGDSMRIGQILINLVNNAIKFTDQGSVIIEVKKLSCEEQQAKYQFSVADTGIGMDEEQQRRLFQSFSQADSSITRKFGGTGLGLTICKQLAEAMGGDISVTSTLGEGSEFCFQVNLGISEAANQNAVKYLEYNYRIMLVDDNPLSNNIFQRTLLQFGAGLISFSNHSDAMKALLAGIKNQTPFQLLMLDCQFLESKGIEFLRQLRANPELQALPVVLLVGSKSQPQILEEMIAATLNQILLKPLTPATLFNSISSALGEAPVISNQPLLKNYSAGSLQGIAGARVLVVEDTHINQQVVRELLENAGLVVTLADNGQEALNELAKGYFDIVLMDIQMPVLDGYEATRRIRANPKWDNLPVIAMTAHSQEDDRLRCEASGMNGYLVKPVEPETLFQTLRNWIDSADAVIVPEQYIALDETDKTLMGLPGIDIDGALNRVSGNQPLLARLLCEFYVSYRDTGSKLQLLLEADDKEQAIRLLHTLKGAAGNLGASQISSLSDNLMNCWDQSVERNELFERLLTAMNEVNRGLAAFSGRQQVESVSDDSVDGQCDLIASGKILNDLEILVGQRNSRSRTLLGKLSEALSGQHQELFLLLKEQITNYDYEMATQTIAQLLDLLKQINVRGVDE